MDAYNSLVLDVLNNTDYIGPLNQFCECFLEELFALLPNISSFDFMSLLNPLITIFKSQDNIVIIRTMKTRVFQCLLNEYETMRDSSYIVLLLFVEGEKRELPEFTAVYIRYVQYPFCFVF